MIYYSKQFNADSSINSAFKRKANKWFEENYNKIQDNINIRINNGRDDIQITGSPKYNEYDNSFKQPCELVNYVLPQLKTLYWLFHLPSSIKYDAGQNKFVNIKASLVRKLLIISIQILSTFYIWGLLEKNVAAAAGSNSNRTGALKFMFQVMHIVLAYLNGIFYYTLYIKGEQIKDLLNNIKDLALEFQKQNDCQLPSWKKIHTKVWILIVIIICDGILFVTIGDICNGHWNHLISPESYFNDATKEAVNAFQRIIINDKNYIFNGSDWSFYSKILIGIPYTFIGAYSTLTWCLCFQLILLWGLLFRKVLLIFFNGIPQNENTSSLKFLRQFHKISIFIENFNSVFGMSTFGAILGSIIYMSNQLWSLVNPDDDKDILVKLILASSFYMIATNLFVCSEVNNMASRIAFVLKLRFQNEKIWRENHVDKMDEVTQGLNMVYYDLISNSIGVKGHGFFTITYSFVGTVVSIIATYSILFLQFKTSG